MCVLSLFHNNSLKVLLRLSTIVIFNTVRMVIMTYLLFFVSFPPISFLTTYSYLFVLFCCFLRSDFTILTPLICQSFFIIEFLCTLSFYCCLVFLYSWARRFVHILSFIFHSLIPPLIFIQLLFTCNILINPFVFSSFSMLLWTHSISFSIHYRFHHQQPQQSTITDQLFCWQHGELPLEDRRGLCIHWRQRDRTGCP